MKKCLQCGCENEDQFQFCKKCGARLEEAATPVPPRYCWSCGAKLDGTERFCSKCGANQDLKDGEGASKTGPEPKAPAKEKKKEAKAPETPKKTSGKKKRGWVLAVLLSAAALLVITAAVLLWMLTQKESREDGGKEEPSGFAETDERTEPETEEFSETAEETTEKETETVAVFPIPEKLAARAVASSTLEPEEEYSPENLMDGHADTAWAEGAVGTGTGEYVTYKMESEETVHGIAVLPGLMKNERIYDENSRPVLLRVTAAGKGEVARLDLSGFEPDFENVGSCLLFLDFEEPVETDEITVEIADTELGERYDHTCISEMYLYAYVEEGSGKEPEESDWEITANTAEETEAETEPETPEETAAQIPTAAADYILPDSSSRLLGSADLDALSPEECRLARNEIFARHGRLFKDAGIQQYFNSKSWYQGTIPPDQFPQELLNEVEKANLEFILSYEAAHGY